MKTSKKFWLYYSLLFIPLLAGCFANELDETEETRRVNDQQIQEYITAQGLNAQGTGSGLFYQITTANPTGQEIKNGDSVRVHFVARLLSGAIIDSTRGALRILDGQTASNARPDKFLIGVSSMLVGLLESFTLLKEGERATLLLPSYLAFSGNGTSNIPPFSVLVYDILVEEVKSEAEQIEEYITRKGLSVTQTTESGLKYIRLSEGTPNTKVADGTTIFVTYDGTLLSDTRFDQNTDTTFSFVLGRGSVIAGWDEGLKLMNQGETATFVIPNTLAYGTTGSGQLIPAYAPLAFTLTLIKSEKQRLYEYIAANGLSGDTTSTASGLLYAIEQVGTGTQNPLATSTVQIKYTAGYIDSQGALQIFEIITNAVNLTLDNTNDDRRNTGLVEGLRLMKVGDKRTLLMPSSLGFGASGKGAVPRRVPLVYSVELVGIL
jgi:FKBP-type peptidyl-prolyl cis-trans isomerase